MRYSTSNAESQIEGSKKTESHQLMAEEHAGKSKRIGRKSKGENYHQAPRSIKAEKGEEIEKEYAQQRRGHAGDEKGDNHQGDKIFHFFGSQAAAIFIERALKSRSLTNLEQKRLHGSRTQDRAESGIDGNAKKGRAGGFVGVVVAFKFRVVAGIAKVMVNRERVMVYNGKGEVEARILRPIGPTRKDVSKPYQQGKE